MNRIIFIFILLTYSLAKSPQDCLCESIYFENQKSFLFNNENNTSSHINSFAVFDAFIVYLKAFIFHPLFEFKISQVDLIDSTVSFDKKDEAGIHFANKNEFVLQFELDSTDFVFELHIHKMYWDEFPFFVLDLSDKNDSSWKHQVVLKDQSLDLMLKYICHLTSVLIFRMTQQVHQNWSIYKLFVKREVQGEGFSFEDCLVWSRGQSTLERYKFKIFHPSFRLMDKYSPSYSLQKKVTVDSPQEGPSLPEYLQDPMVFNYVNDWGFNYVLVRLLELSSNFLTTPSDEDSIGHGSLSFSTSEKFVQSIGAIISNNLSSPKLNLTCVKDNSLFMSSTDQGLEAFDSDMNLDFGNKNIISDLLASDYSSFSSEMIKKRDHVYFLILVIESILDLNHTFSRTGQASMKGVFDNF